MVEGLEAIARQLPFPILGIDSDNDSAFIDETLVQYCTHREIEFTRSRPYRKNDQAWVEQRNGFVVRRFTGHDRCSGRIAGQAMVHLYKSVRLHVDYFEPSFKLLEKIRDGAKIIKRYRPPATPCDRLMQDETIRALTKEEPGEYRTGLDPVALLRSIRKAQSAMAAMSSPQPLETYHSESIDRFLARLPSLGKREKLDQLTRREFTRPGNGVPVRISLRGSGARYCYGSRGIRTRPPRTRWRD